MTFLTSKYHSTRNLNKVFLTSIGVRNLLKFSFYTYRYFAITNTIPRALKFIPSLLLIHFSLKSIGPQTIFITEHLINNMFHSILFQTIGSRHPYSTSYILP